MFSSSLFPSLAAIYATSKHNFVSAPAFVDFISHRSKEFLRFDIKILEEAHNFLFMPKIIRFDEFVSVDVDARVEVRGYDLWWHINCPGRKRWGRQAKPSTKYIYFPLNDFVPSGEPPCAIWWINWLVKIQDSYRAGDATEFSPAAIAFKFKHFWLSKCLVPLTEFLLLLPNAHAEPLELFSAHDVHAHSLRIQCKSLHATRSFTPAFKILFNKMLFPHMCDGTKKKWSISSRQITHVGATSTYRNE